MKRCLMSGLRSRSFLLMAMVALIAGAIIFFLFWASYRSVTQQMAHDFVRSHVLWQNERIHGALNRELALSQKMTDSVALHRWIHNEANEQAKQDAFAELDGLSKLLGWDSWFVAIASSGNYYYNNVRGEYDGRELVKRLSPDRSDDRWFYTSLAMAQPYNFNFDYDQELDETKYWINVVVTRDGQRVGVAGTGIDINKFIEGLIKTDEPGISTLLATPDGAILAYEDISYMNKRFHSTDPSDWIMIESLLDATNDFTALREILQGINEQTSEPVVVPVLRDGQKHLAAMAYLPEMDWITITLVGSQVDLTVAQIMRLGVMTLIVMLVMVFVIAVGMDRLILRSIHHVAQSVSRIASGDYEIRLPTDRKDEVGQLNHAFNDMAAKFKLYTEDLEQQIQARTQELLKQDNRFRVLFELSPIGIALNDFQTGQFLTVNNALLKSSGYSREEFLNLTYWEITPREYYAIEQEKREDMRRDGWYSSYEKQYINRQGERYPVLLTGMKFEDATGKELVWSFIVDIRDRKQAEHALAIHYGYQKLIAEIASSYVSSRDLDQTIHDALRQLAEFFKMDRAYVFLYERDDSFIRNTHEWCRANTRPLIHEFEGFNVGDYTWSWSQLESGQPLVISDVSAMPSEAAAEQALYQSQDIQSLICMPLVSEGRSIGFMGFDAVLRKRKWSSDDVTMIRVAAEIFSVAIQRAQANQAMWEAKREAEAASAAKSEFLANLSHEIRTPMTAIMGYAELMENENPSQEMAKEATHAILANSNHLLTIINDILDVSKIEAGKMRIDRMPMDVRALVDEISQMLESRAHNKSIGWYVVYEADVPALITCDPVRLRQILMNLAGNAIKFTQEGSVTLNVRYDKHQPDAMLVFEIVDTGIGMNEQQLALIKHFDAFTQADSSTTRLFGGSGLGLRISNSLAKMLGGSIDVESELGQGSKFIVSINPYPIPEALDRESITQKTSHTENPLDEKGREPQRLKNRNILLAEDGVDNQRLFVYYLTHAGAKVDVVVNGQEAIERIEQRRVSQESPYDLVLMDMQMPVMDGYEATRQLREQGYTGAVIALTAHAMEGDRMRCLEIGCDDYLAKPVYRMTLIETCQQWIATKQDS